MPAEQIRGMVPAKENVRAAPPARNNFFYGCAANRVSERRTNRARNRGEKERDAHELNSRKQTARHGRFRDPANGEGVRAIAHLDTVFAHRFENVGEGFTHDGFEFRVYIGFGPEEALEILHPL